MTGLIVFWLIGGSMGFYLLALIERAWVKTAVALAWLAPVVVMGGLAFISVESTQIEVPVGSKPHAAAQADECDPNYDSYSCVPAVDYDLDCSDGYFDDVEVLGYDPHGFDADGDGWGCES
jgi:hypothetical protein